MKWFRFYSDALDDPKVQRLPPPLFKAWVNILCLASKNDGALPPEDEIAFALRENDETFHETFQALLHARFLDVTVTGYTPHNWREWQQKSDDVNARVRLHRQRKQQDETLPKRYSNVTVTAQTRPEKNREEEKREEIPPVAIATSPKGGKRTPRILVADFQPSEEQVEQAIDYGVPPEQVAFETEKWRDYHAAKGDVVKDAPASWRTWMRNAVTYAAKDRASPGGRASPVTFAQQRQKNNDAAFDAVFSKLREQEANGNGTYRTGDQEIDRGIPGRDDTGEYRRLPHRVPEH